MLAGALLLAVVWVFLLRYVPPDAIRTPGGFVPGRDDLVRAFVPAAAWALVFLLILGLLGGWILAGRMLAPLTRITGATRMAAKGSLSHRIELEGRRTSSASSPTASTPCSRGSKRTSPNSRGSQPTPPTSCAPHWRSRRPSSTSPATIRTATAASSTNAFAPSTPERSTSPKHCCCSAAPTSDLHPRTRRPVPHRGRSHRDPPPPRREARRHHRDVRRRHPHHRLTRTPAADDHEPPAQRHRPQPPRTRHGLGQHQRSPRVRRCSLSRTPATSSPHSWSRHSPNRSSAAPNAYAADHAGVGLGLAIVKSITQAHDGTLTLTPRADGGLCVTVELPAAR